MNLNQVTIASLDLAVSIKFYEKLGLKFIVDAQPNYARFECPDGDSTFSIHKVDLLNNPTGTSIYFECKSLDIKVNSLIEEGLEFEEKAEDKSWLWREARLRDPDNNLIILYYAGKNRKYPPWRLKD